MTVVFCTYIVCVCTTQSGRICQIKIFCLMAWKQNRKDDTMLAKKPSFILCLLLMLVWYWFGIYHYDSLPSKSVRIKPYWGMIPSRFRWYNYTKSKTKKGFDLESEITLNKAIFWIKPLQFNFNSLSVLNCKTKVKEVFLLNYL